MGSIRLEGGRGESEPSSDKRDRPRLSSLRGQHVSFHNTQEHVNSRLTRESRSIVLHRSGLPEAQLPLSTLPRRRPHPRLLALRPHPRDRLDQLEPDYLVDLPDAV